MNITAQALVFAVATVAIAAAVGTGLADSTSPEQQIAKLERVVVVGKRMQAPTEVAVLPRVVITGKRVAESDVHMAAAEVRKI